MHTSERTSHVLRGPKTNQMPRQIVYVDIDAFEDVCEGRPDRKVQRLKCGVAVRVWGKIPTKVDVESLNFYNTGDLWDWIGTFVKRGHPTLVIGCDIGRTLTLTGFWKEVEDGRYLLKRSWVDRSPGNPHHKAEEDGGLVCIEDPPVIIRCWHAQRRASLTILDSRNYWPLSIEQLEQHTSAVVNIAHSPENILAESLHLCDLRCRVLEDTFSKLLRFISTKDMGGLKPTAASTAYAGFLRSYCDVDIYCHADEELLELERNACFGGWCRVFRWGEAKEKVYALDVNSLYPFVMKECYFPVKHCVLSQPASMPQIAEMCNDLLCVAECHLATNDRSYPAHIDGASTYVVGDFWTTLTTPEVMEAYRLGHLKGIGRVAWYHGGKPFGRWVDTLYGERLKARDSKNKSQELICKLFLNSLSGKFAQRSHKWDFQGSESAIMPWGHWCRKRFGDHSIDHLRSLNWNVQQRCDCGEGRESVPALYAHITAYARHHMRTIIEVAGPQNCYYMDTDSLHVNLEGITNLNFRGKLHESKIGYLRADGSCENAHYYGLRDYRFGERFVYGALSTEARLSGQRKAEQWSRDRLSTTLNGTPGNTVSVRLTTRLLPDCHVLGEVFPDGRVMPYRLEEDYHAFRLRLDGLRATGHRNGPCGNPVPNNHIRPGA